LKARLVADEFLVPERLESGRFVLRPLTVNDAVKDYDAVMTSRADLIGLFGPDSPWPSPGLTLEQDLIDLAWHQKEFQIRSSFAYAVVPPDESQVLGCVYLLPSLKRDIDCAVYYWMRSSERGSGLDDSLGLAMRKWLRERWPFRNPAFPGRDIAWTDWEALP
jgi:hypothetical protein